MQNKFNKNEVREMVLNEAIEILKSDKIIPKNKKKIVLTGQNTDFDSVALIKLISSLEDQIHEKFKKNLTIADDKILNNIKLIRDTDSLSKHIYSKLNGKN